MVPVDALTGDLAVFKLHNHDDGNFDPFARRRYAGENPRHLDCVGKLVNQFVHYAVISNRASDRYDFGVRWMTGEEKSAVEVADFTRANA